VYDGNAYDTADTDITVFPDPDIDGDGVPNVSDNAPYVYNPNQADLDGDNIGDVIDPDLDGDGIANESDNAPRVFNPDQADSDGDEVADVIDNAPENWNPDQSDCDGDGIGDIIDSDCSNILSVTSPENAIISGNEITVTVTGLKKLTISVAVSAKASWSLYKDARCLKAANEPITLKNGENIYYIKVTAEDNTTQVYRFTILKPKFW
jgi:hypothetical protein